ncbi:cell division protein DedD [Enterobacterales bacterium CwR94]|nr:cell division protein DedD [Enterobacterales bacterium CwR94]
MASKFQNRLVGTVILVALGVIVLPGLLDGQKKHYKEEFAAIPLVPDSNDEQDSEMVPPVTQALPAQPPQGSGVAPGENTRNADSGMQMPQNRSEPSVITPPPMQTAPAQPAKPVQQTPPAATKPVVPPKTVEKPKPQPKPEPKPEPKPAAEPKAAEAPSGQAYMVQLGALKNAGKVNEIVAQLRLSGYRAWTVPATPVQGEITRIYVGPDASKARMQSAVGELKSISGLSGVVKPYSAR